MSTDLEQFRALSFDCYGTLIDWETGITEALAPWIARHHLDVTREQVLHCFSTHETAVQRAQPTARYPDVLAQVLHRIGDDLGADVTADDAAAFGASVGHWPAFADSAGALARLATRYTLIILSNVDRTSFARSNQRLGATFDRIVTAEDVGAYKPDPRMFTALLAALEELAIPSDQLLHVAESLYHDHEPAGHLGLASAWIHRRHEAEGFGATPGPGTGVTPALRFTSMVELADAAGV